jgi:photosystem II stability/assembly factor-like uncharacterized protein
MIIKKFTLAKCICALAILVSVPLRPVEAQSPFWEQTSGPEGGLIGGMTVDSLDRVLAGTAAGGVFLSDDHGDSWRPINNRIGSAHIKFLESSASYIYALTFTNGMYRYQPNDVTYEWVHLDSLHYGGEITSFVINRTGNLFVAVPRKGVVSSNSNGHFWIETSPQLRDSTVMVMCVDRNGWVFAITKGGHIFRSKDDAASWSELSSYAHADEATGIGVGLNGEIVICDALGSIMRSVDDGASWQSVEQAPNNIGFRTFLLCRANNHMFARTGEGSLYRSKDEGAHWELIDTTIQGGDFFPAATDTSGNIYLGTDFSGVYRSTTDGATWRLSNSGLKAFQVVGLGVNSKSDVFALTEMLVFRTTNRGDTWTKFDLELGQNFANDPITIDELDNVYIGTQAGILFTSNSGASWKYVDSAIGTPTNLVRGLAHSRAGAIFAATEHGLDISTDHGAHWNKVSGDPGTVFMDAVIIGPNDEILASQNTGVIYRSNNAGATWKPIGFGAGLRAAGPTGTLYRVSQGLFRSIDTGKTWTQQFPVSTNPTQIIYDAMVDSKGNVLCATDTGAFRSTNDGGTWQDVSKGLTQESFNRTLGVSTFAESPDGMFYAATRGQGVYRSLGWLNGVAKPLRAGDFVLEQNYPNPFNPMTTIRFNLNRSESARLEVVDIMGRVVATLMSADGVTGAREVQFDGSRLPSGSYYYRLSTPTFTTGRWMTLVR